MDELLLLEAVERYIRGEMTTDERTYFEELRKKNAEIDQLVVEHTYFLQGIEQYGQHKQFRHLLQETHVQLSESGLLDAPKPGPKALVVNMWRKYKRNIAVAASIAGFISLLTTGLTISYNSKTDKASYTELINRINLTNEEIKEIKKNRSAGLPNSTRTEPTKIDYRATGFLIDGKGYLVTNAHVAGRLKNIYVENSKGEYYEARVLISDEQSDLAILKITDTAYKSINNLPYSIRKANADLGDQFFTLGFPRKEIVYGEGYVSAKSGSDGDSTAYQLTVSANPGNSGGPVINRSGEIIGIITGKDSKADGVVFAAKARNIFKLLDQLKKDDNEPVQLKVPAGSSDLKKLDRTQQIRRMEEFVFMVVGNG